MESKISLKSCILLICGLPSSGKSLLTNKLLRHSQTNPFLLNKFDNKSDEKFIFYNICVDQLITINEQSIAIQINGFWKQFRNNLLMASKLFINELINETKLDFINNEMNENISSIYESIKRFNNYSEKNVNNFVLIIDDNFYYRSMRYEWFKIAKQFKMGFALIMINCPLDLALERNHSRNQRRDHENCVPNHVIIKMNQRFESPQLNDFEMRTFNVSTDSLHSINEQLIDFIIDAVHNPVVEQNSVNEEIREQSKNVNQLNIIHRVDCILRQIISERIANSLNKKEIAIVLNKAKNCVLIDLKQSIDILPESLRANIVKTQSNNFDKNSIQLFLNDLLNKKVHTN